MLFSRKDRAPSSASFVRRPGFGAVAFAAGLFLSLQPCFAAETLQWKFKPGETLRYTMVQETVQGMKAMGQEFKTNMSQTIDLHWTVKSVGSDGAAELSQSFDRVRTKVEAPGTTFEFDSQSDKAPEGPLATQMAPVLKALVNAEFQFKMNPKGELSDVKVPANLVETLKKAGPAGGGGMFSEEGLKNLITQSGLALPVASLEPGKSWDQKSRIALPMIGTMVMDTTYTFKGPDAKNAKLRQIAQATKMTLEPAADSNLAVKITGQDGKGEISFDPEAGRVVLSKVDEELQMSLSIQGQTLEQSTKSTTTRTLGKVEPAK